MADNDKTISTAFADNPVTAPLGSLMIPAAVAGSEAAAAIDLFHLRGGVVNVMDYGASPSATAATNDTALAAASAASVAAGGGLVLVPPGQYLISALISLPAGVHLYGLGYRTVYLRAMASSMTMVSCVASGAAMTNIILDGRGVASVGLLLNGANECNFNGVYIQACTLGIQLGNGIPTSIIFFTDLVIAGCATAMDINNAKEVWFSNCNFYGAASGGTYKLITSSDFGAYIHFRDCHMEEFDYFYYINGAVYVDAIAFDTCHFISHRDAGSNATRLAYIACTISSPISLRLINCEVVLTKALYIVECFISDSNAIDVTVHNCYATASCVNTVDWLHSNVFDSRLTTRYYGNLVTTLANQA